VGVRLKRVYEEPSPDDGSRYLVDRLWPRGVSKGEARLDGWLSELAPSDELRQWYHRDPERWGEFKRRYKLELTAGNKQEELDQLAGEAAGGDITLVYAAKDTQHNNAAALAEVLESKLQKRSRATGS
jgi:uncharacterized protein YeaO (DUF488 family)